MAKLTYFDPHYWERCFVFRCRAGCCPFVADCYAARMEDQRRTREIVEQFNAELSKGFRLQNILADRSKALEVQHLIESHGVFFDAETNRFVFPSSGEARACQDPGSDPDSCCQKQQPPIPVSTSMGTLTGSAFRPKTGRRGCGPSGRSESRGTRAAEETGGERAAPSA